MLVRIEKERAVATGIQLIHEKKKEPLVPFEGGRENQGELVQDVHPLRENGGALRFFVIGHVALFMAVPQGELMAKMEPFLFH